MKFQQILEHLVSSGVEHPNGPNVLTKLSEVEINGFIMNGDRTGDGGGEGFHLFVLYSAIPPMRTLRGHHVKFVDNDALTWPYAPRISGLTEIMIQNSAFPPGPLAQLLRGIAGLRRFIYDYNSSMNHDMGAEAHLLIGALSDRARHTLDFLELNGYHNLGDEREDTHPFEGSSQAFTALRDIRIES